MWIMQGILGAGQEFGWEKPSCQGVVMLSIRTASEGGPAGGGGGD